MKISIYGLGGRLQRARKGTGLSQEAAAGKIGVSWMTVHRWERSQRSISEENLYRLCELYNKPLRWFLTLEDGDLEQEPSEKGSFIRASTTAADRLSRKISGAPAEIRPMIEKVAEELLDSLRQSVSRQ